ncbi:MAG TPA: amidohydrolase family protein [Caulobacteraceae bacterium]|nr:amidohydrolase family protein [Caulobacteraceae bacterium]
MTAPETLAGIKVIDVDTHFSEPLDLWTSRASAKWRERVPQMKPGADGRRVWTIDGDVSMGIPCAASVIAPDGGKTAGLDFFTKAVDQVHDACSQVAPRLKVMDETGVFAQVVYPNVLGFGGQGPSARVDPELRLVSTQIYNDAAAEMQEASGGRLYPMALLPWWDVRLSVAEAQRCKAMGLRGVNINSDPHRSGMEDLSGDYWTPLWEYCGAEGLPVNFHIGASDASTAWFSESAWPSLSGEAKLALGSTMLFLSNARVLVNLIVSGLLERFPKLKFVSVESGVGWIPFVLEALDYSIVESSASAGLSMAPIDYFRRQVFACFWFERKELGAAVRAVGVDNVMFETDFPHPTCLYPRPLERAAMAMADFTAEERRKLLSGNAARLYGIPLN